MKPARFIFWCVMLLLAMAATPFRVVEVDGRSMMPTLRDGERYLVDRYYWRSGGLKRDDVIVLKNRGEDLVKRLVGQPGDKLEIVMDYGNVIYELANLTTGQKSRLAVTPGDGLHKVRVTVPAKQYYVLGDNWWRSDDSRTFGFVPERNIIGVLRTFTLNRAFPRQAATQRY